MDEPIADEVRAASSTATWPVMDRSIASRGRYPAIDVTVSLSRRHGRHRLQGAPRGGPQARALLGVYEAKRDLITLGAYVKGSDPEVDEAVAKMPRIEQFLRQDPKEPVEIADTIATLLKIVS